VPWSLDTCCTQRSPSTKCESTAPQIETSICTGREQLISSSDDNNVRAAHWADHQWKAEWLDNTTRLRTFIPDTGTRLPGMILPRTAWVRLYRFTPGSDVSAPVCTNGVWPPLRPVSVAQKNKPSTTLSSNVQSMPAQNLLRYLVRPSSGQPQLAETTKKIQ